MVFFWKRRTHATDKRQRIVILGGGFAGVYTALRLEKTLARDPDIEIVLVSRDNFLLFTPMLHEVVTGEIGPGKSKKNTQLPRPAVSPGCTI